MDKYNKILFNTPNSRPDFANETLPKIIHMTWLGSQLPFSKFLKNIQSYTVLNPEHKLYLWLDHSLPSKLFESFSNVIVKDVRSYTWETEDLLEKATNWAMKSDILRLEILYKYGGIYIDIDSTALRPFGEHFLERIGKEFAKNLSPLTTTRDAIF